MGSGILSWGINDSGQLGVANPQAHSTPVEVAAPGIGLDVGMIRDVSAGNRHSLALTFPMGEVLAWGDNRFGQLGDNLASIGGQSGLDWSVSSEPDIAPVNNPVRVAGANGVGLLTGVTKIAAGQNHCLAIRADNTVWAWGRNNFGQLGDNSTNDRWVPVQVRGLPEGIPHAIAAGHDHSLAVLLVDRPAPGDQTSQIWAWGANHWGQLGDGSSLDFHGLESQ